MVLLQQAGGRAPPTCREATNHSSPLFTWLVAGEVEGAQPSPRPGAIAPQSEQPAVRERSLEEMIMMAKYTHTDGGASFPIPPLRSPLDRQHPRMMLLRLVECATEWPPFSERIEYSFRGDMKIRLRMFPYKIPRR